MEILVAGGYYFYGNFSPFFCRHSFFVITCNDFVAGKMIEKSITIAKKKKVAVFEYGEFRHSFYVQIFEFCGYQYP